MLQGLVLLQNIHVFRSIDFHGLVILIGYRIWPDILTVEAVNWLSPVVWTCQGGVCGWDWDWRRVGEWELIGGV